MSVLNRIPPEIMAEAAAWLARLHADGKCAADEQAFRAWLAADPRHTAAFEMVTEIWELTGATCEDDMKQLPKAPAMTRRRAMFAGAGTLAAAGMCVAVWQRASATVYETAVGEQKHVVLRDGTQMFLDTDTSIRATFGSRQRAISVERGRCNFHVSDGDERPFVVDAAAQSISAGPSAFDVRRDGNDVCVVMVQGTASVGGTVLKPGERMVVAGGVARVDRPNLVPLMAWQTGQAVFDNETILGAAREMNRYSAVKIVVDPAVAGMRISGVYHVGDNVAFARSLSALLPVNSEIGGNQVRLVANRNGTK
jgi:transmembrane sensor